MKKLLFIAAAFILGTGVAVAQKTYAKDFAKFNTEKHNFGKIKQNIPATYVFEITNITNKPLVIENAHATCGCTVPEYQKDPIMPGKSGKIKVQFNAAAGGPFEKTVYVKLAGVDEEKALGIVGEVLTPEKYDDWVKENASKSKSKNKSKSGR